MICFVFPGQGSQREQMGKAWVEHPSWELVDEASEAANRDLSHLLLAATPEELSMTRNTQISTFLTSMVVLDSIERLGVFPQICAGHSLGEYSALVGSGAITFDSAVSLVCERGEAMQIASEENPGSMAALLGGSDEQVEELCAHIGVGLYIANYNSEGQTVVAGLDDAIEKLFEVGKDFGIKRIIKLPVGGAFHTPLINSAQGRLAKAIKSTKFYDSDIPVIANVDAQEHSSAVDWPELLLAQLCSPVRWKQTMEHIAQQQPNLIVEVGPGGVLAGLLRRAMPNTPILSVAKPDDLDSLLEAATTQGPFHDWATSHHGERFYSSERLVVSPTSGVFHPTEITKLGKEVTDSPQRVEVGESLGTVGSVEVRSPFAGTLQGMIAVSGERVIMGQPIAWLRNEESK